MSNKLQGNQYKTTDDHSYGVTITKDQKILLRDGYTPLELAHKKYPAEALWLMRDMDSMEVLKEFRSDLAIVLMNMERIEERQLLTTERESTDTFFQYQSYIRDFFHTEYGELMKKVSDIQTELEGIKKKFEELEYYNGELIDKFFTVTPQGSIVTQVNLKDVEVAYRERQEDLLYSMQQLHEVAPGIEHSIQNFAEPYVGMTKGEDAIKVTGKLRLQKKADSFLRMGEYRSIYALTQALEYDRRIQNTIGAQSTLTLPKEQRDAYTPIQAVYLLKGTIQEFKNILAFWGKEHVCEQVMIQELGEEHLGKTIGKIGNDLHLNKVTS